MRILPFDDCYCHECGSYFVRVDMNNFESYLLCMLTTVRDVMAALVKNEKMLVVYINYDSVC